MTIKANWTANGYTLTANANGGTIPTTDTDDWKVASGGATATKTVTYDSTYGTLPTPTRAGYTFSGWYNGATKIESTTKVTATSAHTITAQWTINGYTLTIDPNGGYRASDSSAEIITVTKEFGSSETISERKRNGYELTGYTVKNTTSGSTTDLGGATFSFSTSTKEGTFVQGSVAITLTAQWKAIEYTITINENGGSSADDLKYTISTSQQTKALPSIRKTGYTLSWQITTNSIGQASSVSGNTLTLPAGAHGNITVKANWTANGYIVTANANGGTIPATDGWTVASGSATATKTVTYDSEYGTLPTPTRTGYTFKGWYNGDAKITSTTKVTATSDHTITANWEENSYTLTANANGGTIPTTDGWTGSGTTVTKSIKYTEAYGTLPTPTRNGYTFAGWYTASSSGTKVETTTKLNQSNPANTTIYAQWTAIEYTISIDENGGESVDDLTYKTSTSQQTKTLTQPTRTGYTFNKWEITTNCTGTASVSGSTLTIPANAYGNITVRVNWTANTYTVEYSATNKDGTISGTGSMASTTVTYGVEYTAPECGFTAPGGFEFDYWSASDGSNWKGWIGRPWVWSYTHGITLYAEWKAVENGNKITIDENGGSSVNDMTYTSSISQQSITLPTVTRTGYTFSKWEITTNTNLGTASVSGSILTIPAKEYGDITVKAIWTGIEYTISIDENGGTTVADLKYTTGAAQTKTLTQPTRAGYSFSKWEITTNCTGTASVSGNTLTIPANAYGNITVKAIWTGIEYTILIDENGGSNVSDLKYTTGAQQTKTLTQPARDGYTFSKWIITTNSSGSASSVNGNTLTIPANAYGNITVQAQWTINSYTLTINPAGGKWNNTTSNSTRTKDYNTMYEVADPTRDGYTFSGWTLTGGGSLSGNIYTFGTSDGTLTAIWAVNKYGVKLDYANGTNINLFDSRKIIGLDALLTYNASNNTWTAGARSGNTFNAIKIQRWNDNTFIEHHQEGYCQSH